MALNPTNRTLLRPLLLLALIALPTGGMAMLKAGLSIDTENNSMKSIGTRQEQDLARRIALFGEDHAILTVFESDDHALLGSLDLEDLSGQASEIEGVIVAFPYASSTDRMQALMVLLEGESSGRGYSEAVERVQHWLSQHLPGGVRLSVTGQPAAEIAIAQAVSNEQKRVVPWVASVLLILLLAIYRKLGTALAALLPATAGIAWTGGAFALAGHRLDPISSLIEPVILTIGVAGSIHLVEAFKALRREGLSPREAARLSIEELAFPATLTVATTIAGFLALGTHQIPAVQRFGVFAGLAASMTCVLTFLMTPALLQLFSATGDAQGSKLPVRKIAEGWTRWVGRHRVGVSLVFLLAGTLASIAWTQIRVDTDPVAVLPADSAFRTDLDRIAPELGGIEHFDIFLPAGSPAASPDKLLALKAWLLEQPLIPRVSALMRRAKSGEQLVGVLLAPSGTRARELLFEKVDNQLELLGAEHAFVTGTAVRVARDSGELVRGQLEAFLLTLVVVFVAGIAGFRSLRLATLGLLPNLLPCLVVYGAMALSGRPLSVASAMIGSVMLGLIVDDTIHFLYRFRQARLRGGDREAALREALERAGRPIILTTIALSGGFLASLGGSLATTHEFAVLASATILLALAADLLLLPALLLMRSSHASVTVQPLSSPARSPRVLRWLPLAPLLLTLVLVLAHEQWREPATTAHAVHSAEPFLETLAEFPEPRESDSREDGSFGRFPSEERP